MYNVLCTVVAWPTKQRNGNKWTWSHWTRNVSALSCSSRWVPPISTGLVKSCSSHQLRGNNIRPHNQFWFSSGIKLRKLCCNETQKPHTQTRTQLPFIPNNARTHALTKTDSAREQLCVAQTVLVRTVSEERSGSSVVLFEEETLCVVAAEAATSPPRLLLWRVC